MGVKRWRRKRDSNDRPMQATASSTSILGNPIPFELDDLPYNFLVTEEGEVFQILP